MFSFVPAVAAGCVLSPPSRTPSPSRPSSPAFAALVPPSRPALPHPPRPQSGGLLARSGPRSSLAWCRTEVRGRRDGSGHSKLPAGLPCYPAAAAVVARMAPSPVAHAIRVDMRREWPGHPSRPAVRARRDEHPAEAAALARGEGLGHDHLLFPLHDAATTSQSNSAISVATPITKLRGPLSLASLPVPIGSQPRQSRDETH